MQSVIMPVPKSDSKDNFMGALGLKLRDAEDEALYGKMKVRHPCSVSIPVLILCRKKQPPFTTHI